MDDLIESALTHLRRHPRRFAFGTRPLHVETPAPSISPMLPVKDQEKPLRIAPEPKPVALSTPQKVKPQKRVDLAPPSVTKPGEGLTLSLLEKIGVAPVSEIIDDSAAQRVRFAYKDKKHVPDIPILLSGNAYKPFLDNVAHAIQSKFGSSRVLSCDALAGKNKWNVLEEATNVKLFLLPDFVLSQYSVLQEGYLENGTHRMLFGKPLLLLPDLSLYMKDPDLKRSLWNILCTMLTK